MNIAEMHVWFRQYAQQMGMQNVRAILPEQIDILINTSITDTINQLIRENIGLTNDRIITDNSKLGQINALRTLYRVKLLDMSPEAPSGTETRVFNFSASDRYTGKMTTDFAKVSEVSLIPDYLFLVDFSLNYKQVENGSGYTGSNFVRPRNTVSDIEPGLGGEAEVMESYVQPTFIKDGIETNFFPVRLIDDSYLADTLNDFVLKNRLRSPIIVTYNNGTFDLYIDKFHEVNGSNGKRYVLDNNLIPYKFRMSYIGKPAKVKYAEDISGENIDCDLPESMHVDILKHAVDLYNVSIQGSLYAAQQQQQRQAREDSRNTARPTNEGYQVTQ